MTFGAVQLFSTHEARAFADLLSLSIYLQSVFKNSGRLLVTFEAIQHLCTRVARTVPAALKRHARAWLCPLSRQLTTLSFDESRSAIGDGHPWVRG